MNNNHSNKINIAIDKFFKSKKASNGIVRVSFGPQFSRGGVVGGWFLMLFFLLIAIILIIQDSFLFSIPIFLLCILILFYIIDYQGIELDIGNEKIRNYKSFLGIRSGVWHYLNNFNRLKIYQDIMLEGRSLESGTTYGSSSHDTHHFYTLYLISDDGSSQIKLCENESVTKVKVFGAKFAQVSELELIQKISKNKAEII